MWEPSEKVWIVQLGDFEAYACNKLVKPLYFFPGNWCPLALAIGDTASYDFKNEGAKTFRAIFKCFRKELKNSRQFAPSAPELSETQRRGNSSKGYALICKGMGTAGQERVKVISQFVQRIDLGKGQSHCFKPSYCVCLLFCFSCDGQ